MDDPFKRLKEINEQKNKLQLDEAKHNDLVTSNIQTQQVILQSFTTLIEYLSNRVSKTEVINQLEQIGTPDVAYVVDSLNSLHDTLKTHENTDLTEITSVMKQVLDEAKKIPKELPEFKEREEIDYSTQLEAMQKCLESLEDTVKDKELRVEAPIVNVDAPQVTVDAPDLKPLTNDIKKTFTEAVKKIVIPDYSKHNDKVEKELTKANKLLAKIADKPSGGGSNSGGLATPYVDSNSIPVFPVVDANGNIPTASTPSDSYKLVQIDDTSSASYEYYAYMNKNSAWYIKRLTTATSLFEFTTPVSTTYSTGWTNRSSLTYLAYGGAF